MHAHCLSVTKRPRRFKRERGTQCGFTLTELAIVLLIVALLVGGLLVPLSSQVDLRNASDTEKTLAEIREALLGYAASHTDASGRPYLPCPDTDDDGVENRPCNTPATQEGRIPWADLGLARTDAWNNRFRYRVDPNFSNSSAGFQLTTSANLKVCADSACATKIADKLPAVIVSHGKNGAGAFNASGGENAAPTDADELENTDANNTFVGKTPDANFDDILGWIPPGILMNRMVTAGKLP